MGYRVSVCVCGMGFVGLLEVGDWVVRIRMRLDMYMCVVYVYVCWLLFAVIGCWLVAEISRF